MKTKTNKIKKFKVFNLNLNLQSKLVRHRKKGKAREQSKRHTQFNQ